LPPEEQARLREGYRRYRELPPEQRAEARKRWEQLPPEDREQTREKMREKRKPRDRDDPREH